MKFKTFVPNDDRILNSFVLTIVFQCPFDLIEEQIIFSEKHKDSLEYFLIFLEQCLSYRSKGSFEFYYNIPLASYFLENVKSETSENYLQINPHGYSLSIPDEYSPGFIIGYSIKYYDDLGVSHLINIEFSSEELNRIKYFEI